MRHPIDLAKQRDCEIHGHHWEYDLWTDVWQCTKCGERRLQKDSPTNWD